MNGGKPAAFPGQAASVVGGHAPQMGIELTLFHRANIFSLKNWIFLLYEFVSVYSLLGHIALVPLGGVYLAE